MLLKDWSNIVLHSKTKICQALAGWTHFCHTRNSSLQQRQPQEAGRQSLLKPRGRCSHLAVNSSIISSVWWKKVDFRRDFSKNASTDFSAWKTQTSLNLQWATGRGKYDFKDSPAGASLCRNLTSWTKTKAWSSWTTHLAGKLELPSFNYSNLWTKYTWMLYIHLGKESHYQAFHSANHLTPKDTNKSKKNYAPAGRSAQI